MKKNHIIIYYFHKETYWKVNPSLRYKPVVDTLAASPARSLSPSQVRRTDPSLTPHCGILPTSLQNKTKAGSELGHSWAVKATWIKHEAEDAVNFTLQK